MDKSFDGKVVSKESCWDASTRRFLIESSTCRNAWLCTAVLLFLLGLTLVICGAIYQAIVVPLFLSGAICVLFAVPLFALYCWHTRCRGAESHRTSEDMEKPENGHVSTVSSTDYYQQTPSGMKSDYPMGPLLVMTLPRRQQPQETTTFVETSHKGNDDAQSLKSAISTTPDMLSGRKYGPLSSKKNLPPLASAETLSPSLLSSHMSIDSVI